MREALDLKNAVEDILSSYEARIKTIGSILDTTQLLFSELQESILDTKEERETISIQLRNILARNEHLRRKDFDNMMQNLLSTQEQREKEVRNLLKEYFNEQKEMAQSLRESLEKFRNSLAGGETERVKEFQALIKDILAKQEKRKDEITFKLKRFQRQQQDLATTLRNLLAKGSNLRIKDLKLMLNEFKVERESRLVLQKRRKEEVAKMLAGFKKKRQRVSPKAIHPALSTMKKIDEVRKSGVGIDAKQK